MFSWFRKKKPSPAPQEPAAPAPAPIPPAPCAPAPAPTVRPPPPVLPANPGQGTRGRVAFADGERTWEERFDLIELLARAMEKHGYVSRAHHEWLEHPETGLRLQPQLVAFQPRDDGHVSTTTTLQVSHPTLIPEAVFEYQHSIGQNLDDALCKGFDQWAQVDFFVFLEALRPQPEKCMTMVMSFPATDTTPARHRRVIFGPVMHFQLTPPPRNDDDEHPFCPCCLFTRTLHAYKSVVESDHFYAMRFYAARGEDGNPAADCRVNGEDCNEGAEALRQYVQSWPDAGLEFRKQYVIIQSVPADQVPQEEPESEES